jgi:MraZ protein
MALISGEYPVTMDEKGRLSIPAKLRDNFPDNQLVLSKGWGKERRIWVHGTSDQLKSVVSKLKTGGMSGGAMSYEQSDGLKKWFIPHPAEIDKTGRVAIPQKLREFAALSKECTVVCDGDRLEIWDSTQYAIYEEKIERQLYEVIERMGPIDPYGD